MLRFCSNTSFKLKRILAGGNFSLCVATAKSFCAKLICDIFSCYKLDLQLCFVLFFTVFYSCKFTSSLAKSCENSIFLCKLSVTNCFIFLAFLVKGLILVFLLVYFGKAGTKLFQKNYASLKNTMTILQFCNCHIALKN